MRFDPERFPALYALFRVYTSRKYAYEIIFRNHNLLPANVREGAQRRVLSDLARFCHADSAAVGDREAGKRDVWLYLNRLLRLDAEELAVLYSGLSPEARYQVHHPGASYTEGDA